MSHSPLSAVLRHIHALAERAPGTVPSDQHLLDRFTVQREEAAFATLVRRHGGMVLGVARRILHDVHAAEDVFQNTFLILARDARSIRKGAALASWLYGVAARLASQMKTRDARRLARERMATSRLPEDVTKAAAWRDLGAVLDEELQRLPEKYRTPLVLIYFAGQTQEEAAQQLGCSKGALRGRLERGKRLLHDRLLRRGVSLSLGLLATAIAQSAASAALPSPLLQQTVQEALRVTATKTAMWAAGASWLARAKITLAMGVLMAGAGVAVLGIVPSKQPETLPESAKSATEAKQPRVDRFGDPLPEGALARLGTVRFRHGAGTSAVFAPDGKSLLTCGGDRTIRTWDTASGRLLHEEYLPSRPFFSAIAILSPDGGLLAFVDTPGTLVLWDVARHRLRHKLSLGGASWPRAVFSPNGKALVTGADVGAESGSVQAWDVATGKSRLLGRHKGMVYSLAFAADGTLMSLGEDHVICFWDLAAGRERSRMTVPKEVVSATISADGKTVATWTNWNEALKRELQFWNAPSGKPKTDWRAPDMRGIHAVRFLPDGKTILVGAGEQGDVWLWDAVAGKRLRALPGKSGCQFVLSHDGKTAASLGGVLGQSYCLESMVHVWDLSTGVGHNANNPEHGHLGAVEVVAFSPDGRTIASFCPVDHRVRLWDAASGRPLRSFSLRKELVVCLSLRFSPDGKEVLVGTGFALLRREVATGREVSRHQLADLDKDRHYFPLMTQWTGDGRTLLGITQNQTGKGAPYDLHAWDAASGKNLRSVPFSTDDTSTAMAASRFSPDGRLLALPGGLVCDTATGKELFRLTAKGEQLGAPVAFSPDGAFLALNIWRDVPRDGMWRLAPSAVQIWETATLSPVKRLETGELTHLAFTADSRRLVTVDAESLKLWDVPSGRLVTRRRVPGRIRGVFASSFASSIALAPNSRALATGQPDTTVLIWDLSDPHSDKLSAPLTAEQRETCWTDLAGVDGSRAISAIARLTDAPAQAVELLRSRLHPTKAPPADELRRLLADLDDAHFERREAATKRLAELDDTAYAALRAALGGKPSLEVRRRIEGLLAESHLARTPEARRHVRAVRVLEHIGNREARQVLEDLAKGAPEARLTRAAKAALTRLMRPTNP